MKGPSAFGSLERRGRPARTAARWPLHAPLPRAAHDLAVDHDAPVGESVLRDRQVEVAHQDSRDVDVTGPSGDVQRGDRIGERPKIPKQPGWIEVRRREEDKVE